MFYFSVRIYYGLCAKLVAGVECSKQAIMSRKKKRFRAQFVVLEAVIIFFQILQNFTIQTLLVQA